METANPQSLGRWRRSPDSSIGWSSAAVTVAVLVVWTAADGEQAKYILYTLPFALFLLHVLLRDFSLQIDRQGCIALGAYSLVALLSLLHNRSLGPYGIRDLAIIWSYLLIFTLHSSIPRGTVALAAVGLSACLAIEAARDGFHLSINLLTSEGIVESGLAFPLGIIVLYYLHEKRWLAAAIVFVLFFAASKRIAFVGALAALAFDPILRTLGLPRHARWIAAALVAAGSIVGLFTMQIFEWGADFIQRDGTSASDISLGRFDFARVLWEAINEGSLGDLLFGFGPGAADATVVAAGFVENPHNDWLKVFFDYGIAGFVAMQVAFFCLFSNSAFRRLIYIYTAILMITDNTLIYMFHQVIIFLVVQAERSSHRRQAMNRVSNIPIVHGDRRRTA
jgi:O-Antigen ligase